MNAVQACCDHDWEIYEAEGYKVCTYPECQLEQELTSEDFDDMAREQESFEIDQYHDELSRED